MDHVGKTEDDLKAPSPDQSAESAFDTRAEDRDPPKPDHIGPQVNDKPGQGKGASKNLPDPGHIGPQVNNQPSKGTGD